MFNNPYNLPAEEFHDSYGVYQDNPLPNGYLIFGAQVRRNNALYYTINRLVLQRDGSITLSEDHAFFWRDAPAWLTQSQNA